MNKNIQILLVAEWRKSVAAVGGDCSVNTGGGRVVTNSSTWSLDIGTLSPTP